MRPVEHEHLQIGDNAIFNSGTVIYLGSKIGNGFKTGHNVVIREEVLIGDNVSVWGNSTVDYGVILGNNVKVHTSCYIAQYTHIENDVFLAPGVIIGNDIHPGCAFSHECMKRFAVRIKRGAQIGLNVTILPGVVIGEGAVVGAGTVVTKDVPDHSVVVGNPARVIKKTSEVVCLLPERKGYCPYK
ncbi:MAG: N-acetyltransferase [Candidatus Moranbacteria bacterium]|nr:N-acetyltransferase [Candidatus Moranbacteria bacterium]